MTEYCIDLQTVSGKVGRMRLSNQAMFNLTKNLLIAAGAVTKTRPGQHNHPFLCLPDQPGFVEYITRVQNGLENQIVGYFDTMPEARQEAADHRHKGKTVIVTVRSETVLEEC